MSRALRIAVASVVLVSLAAFPAVAQNRPGGGFGGKGGFPGGYGGFGGGVGSTPTLEKAKVTVLFVRTDNATDMIPKILGSVAGVDNVKVDLKTKRATMLYSGVTTGLEKVEQAGASYGVRLMDPALVEFAVKKTGGQVQITEVNQKVRETVRDVLAISSANLLVSANLESADWAKLLADVKGCGYELKGKSHSFLTVNWTAGAVEEGKEDPTLKAIAATPGVLVVKPVEGGGQALIVATPNVTGAALGKAAKEAGSKLGKVLPGWPPPPVPPAPANP